MKFIIKSLNEGKYCLLFTPALMTLLWLLYSTGQVNEDTDINPILVSIINWRYSESGFSLFIILGFLISSLTIFTIRTQKIPKHEKIRLAKALTLAARFTNNMLLFWSGVFIAWSFGSHLIPFVPAIKAQETMAILLIPIAIWFKYQILKIKHWSING